ncbi:ARM repeat superfamily protein [Wolffia australiana]
MEDLLLKKLCHLHQTSSKSDDIIKSLITCRALICSSAVSESSLTFVSTSILHFIEHGRGQYLPFAIKLFSDLVIPNPSYSPPLIDLCSSLISTDNHQAEALSALLTIARSGGEGKLLVKSVLKEDLVLSLAGSRVVSVRSQLLRLLFFVFLHGQETRAAEDDRDHAVLRVFFGLTADLYPTVRSLALDGLVLLCKKWSVGCDVGVELLHDDDVFVRLSAVRLVSGLTQLRLETTPASDRGKFSDSQFLKLCPLARDMDVRVRVEVLLSLEKIKLVSEIVLLQTLTKKIMKVEHYGIPISCAAGVFLQGLEDEYHEVRRAACFSLGGFVNLYAKFSSGALDLLMDMLNDDSDAVQLQALQTLLQMAKNNDLIAQESHMHMFLGTLTNIKAQIRNAARKVIRFTGLRNLDLFRQSVNALLRNMEEYREDAKDILSTIFCIGKTHGGLATRITNERYPEIEQPGPEEFKLGRPRVLGLLVLGISSSLSNEKLTHTFPEKIFLYALPLLGRISPSLEEFISRDDLLSFLCNCAGLPFAEETESPSKDLQPVAALTASAIKQTLKRVSEVWKMMKTRSSRPPVKALRACREQLEMFDQNVCDEDFTGALIFCIEYIHVLELVAEIWEQMQPKDLLIIRTNKLDLLLKKLEKYLGRLRFLSLGLTEKEETHLLELSLLQCALSLSAFGSTEATQINIKIKSLLTRLEQLTAREKPNSYSWSTHIVDFPDLLTLEDLDVRRGLRARKSELRARVVDREFPLAFVPGLPVGIPLDITLQNICDSDSVWLRMTGGGATQYGFLSVDRFGGSHLGRSLAVDLPFYATPRVPFLLRVVVCLECPSGDLTGTKSQHGPRRETVDLSQEVEIYLEEVGKSRSWC